MLGPIDVQALVITVVIAFAAYHLVSFIGDSKKENPLPKAERWPARLLILSLFLPTYFIVVASKGDLLSSLAVGLAVAVNSVISFFIGTLIFQGFLAFNNPAYSEHRQIIKSNILNSAGFVELIYVAIVYVFGGQATGVGVHVFALIISMMFIRLVPSYGMGEMLVKTAIKAEQAKAEQSQ